MIERGLLPSTALLLSRRQSKLGSNFHEAGKTAISALRLTMRPPPWPSGKTRSVSLSITPSRSGEGTSNTAMISADPSFSCVDRGASRQDIQSLDPEILIGGSTLGLAARSDFYPQRSGAACLSCRNPAERDGEKIQAFKEQLRSMSRDQRACFLIEHGVDSLAVEEYLAREQCGTLGERAVNDLATRTPPAFSVGFVSLGAALLLASALFRLTLFRETAVDRGDMSALNFLNGGFGDAFIGPDEDCEWGCQERRAG
jgi:hypothetical protein